jgi:hypothetical protein
VDDFYIGYDPPMPRRLAQFTRRLTCAFAIGGLAAAVLLAREHLPLDGGTFAYGHLDTITGRLVARPYPYVIDEAMPGAPATLLVATGKHGAGPMVSGLDGRRVRLTGTRIDRDGTHMAEVRADTIVAIGPPMSVRRERGSASDGVTPPTVVVVELHGEVVDSKCYLGVMVPGEGRTHAACAGLCVRGGIPPALLVRTAEGTTELYLLETPSGDAIGPDAAAWAGTRVTVRGVTGTRAGWHTLRTQPAEWHAATP